MKKNKWILIIMLLLYPTVVFASSASEETLSLGMAILMEVFISIHMSFFVLLPLSKIFTKENDKKIFWSLFIIRALVLLYFDFFVTTSIAIVDFIAVFVGAFIVVPICMAITKPFLGKRDQLLKSTVLANSVSNSAANTAVMINCPKCGNVMNAANKYCPKCYAQVAENKVTVAAQPIQPKVIVNPNNFDSMYKLSEDKMVEEYINRQLVKAGVDITTNLIPSDILQRKKVLNIIFSILTFAFVSLIFFHFPVNAYIIGLVILFIFYKLTGKYDLMKYLKKQLKARPSEKISNIIMTTKSTFVEDNSKKNFIVSLSLAIILSLLIFINPRILYEKIDNGYAVRFYTFGITNFTSVTIPETYKNEKVISLRGNTFSNMPFLKEVTLPDTIIEIRGQAFKNNKKLTKVNIPNSLEYLGGGAFYNCTSITSINIPDTVTYIGGEAFYNAKSLESIKLSNNITEIRGNTFENCSSLKSITIPDSVTRIGGHAFYGCSSLSEVKLTENSQLNEIGSSAFRMCDSLYTITLPKNISINERSFKESPTSINYFDLTQNVSKNIVTVKNNGEVSYITTTKYGTIALSISNAYMVGNYLHVTLNLSGGINKRLNLICDGSTTDIYDDFYITTNRYMYKPATTTFNFYY